MYSSRLMSALDLPSPMATATLALAFGEAIELFAGTHARPSSERCANSCVVLSGCLVGVRNHAETGLARASETPSRSRSRAFEP